MEDAARTGRTARLLEARLESLAATSERSLQGMRAYDVQILAVSAATRHAVALDLISPEEARAIWARVANRHPAARWCRTWSTAAAWKPCGSGDAANAIS